jgi:hypothetical protein
VRQQLVQDVREAERKQRILEQQIRDAQRRKSQLQQQASKGRDTLDRLTRTGVRNGGFSFQAALATAKRFVRQNSYQRNSRLTMEEELLERELMSLKRKKEVQRTAKRFVSACINRLDTVSSLSRNHDSPLSFFCVHERPPSEESPSPSGMPRTS